MFYHNFMVPVISSTELQKKIFQYLRALSELDEVLIISNSKEKGYLISPSKKKYYEFLEQKVEEYENEKAIDSFLENKNDPEIAPDSARKLLA